MTVIELPQGYFRGLSGTHWADAADAFADFDATFLEKNPQCAPYHRPCWRAREVADDATAPWGHEWYVVDAAGNLQLYSACYDSSG